MLKKILKLHFFLILLGDYSCQRKETSSIPHSQNEMFTKNNDSNNLENQSNFTFKKIKNTPLEIVDSNAMTSDTTNFITVTNSSSIKGDTVTARCNDDFIMTGYTCHESH